MKSRNRILAICMAAACLFASALASTAEAAAPGWSVVAASGPTNLPPVQSEVQRVSVDATGGTYTLTHTAATATGTLTGASFTGNLTSGSNVVTLSPRLSASVSAPAIGQEIVGPGIPAGTTITARTLEFGVIIKSLTLSANAGQTLSGASLVAGLKQVTGVSTSFGAFAVGDTISGTGIAPGTTITACSPSCAAATSLTISALPSASGSKALTATETTAPIAFDAEASQVAAALNALPAIGGAGAGVTVSGGPGAKGGEEPYFVAFEGSLGSVNVPQLTADGSALSGGNNHTAAVSTAVNGGPGTATIMIYAQNVGGAPSSGTTTMEFTLPPNVTTTETPAGGGGPGTVPWVCGLGGTAGADQSSGKCETSEVVSPGFTHWPVKVPVKAGPGAGSGIVHVVVSGGGSAGVAEYEMPLVVSAIPASPGFQSFNAGTYDEDGVPYTHAGAHPFSASAAILINTKRAPSGVVVPAGEFRDIVVDTPPGFIGNPIAPEQCPEATELEDCDPASIVGTAQIPLNAFSLDGTETQEKSSVSNVEAPYGYPAKLRFITGTGQDLINVAASLRSDEDYGLEIGSYDTPQIKPVYGSFFTIWGTPAAAGHDEERCAEFDNNGHGHGCGPGGENVPFLTNPVDCSEEALRPPVATLNVNTWQNPGLWFSADHSLPTVEHCDQLDFNSPAEPVNFTFEPSETKADSPASFRTELTVPSAGLLDPAKQMTPTIKETVVDLPKGVVLNASAADGLEACSEAQIGLKGTGFPAPNHIRFTKDPQSCPDASRIGTGELKSELIEEPLHGALYLAAQGDGNPFGSLFAIYLVIEDPRHGIFIKLPGEVQVNAADGQQRIVFRDLPPLPFSYLRLTLKGGPRSPLASPITCGEYVTTATNTPWSAPESGPAATSANGFAINQGPNGLPCANSPGDRPFDIGWNAGAENVTAGADGPFNMQVTRPDGSQELTGLSLKTPKGISASLKGIPQCSAAQIARAEQSSGKQEQSDPACPAASQVGTLTTGAGSGPSPFYVTGKLYLAGPYKGAPLSVVAITPAVAGPFDLGNVVVRSAVNIDRTTAQVSANSDEIPQILKGVALRIRDVRISLNRKDWTINPTSCDPSTVDLTARGANGAIANRSVRFQVGGCDKLAFKPKLKAHLKGGTKRGKHPAFTAELTYPEGPGYANIKDVQVTIPHSEFLDQAHIRTICTRPQAAAHQCPPGSIYGYAEAETPLLDGKLTGPVFLKSSDHQLPDLAIALRGPDNQPVEVEFQGRIDSIKGQIRNTIEGLPDVPVSKFVLRMKGGRKGLLVNSRDLCAGKVTRMTVDMTAQNNRTSSSRPPLKRRCNGAKRARNRHGGHRRPGGATGGHRARLSLW